MTLREIVGSVIKAYERGTALASRGRLWWRRWWLWVIGVPMVLGVYVVIRVMWKIAGQPVPGVSELFSQMQMVISGTQAVIALVVGLTVMYSAKTTADSHREERRRALDDAHSARVSRAVAIAGAAVDAATYGGTLATIQKQSLSRFRVPVRGEEQLRLETWKGLTDAASAAARAVQHVRFSEDEALESAEQLLAVVTEVVRLAAAGDFEGVDSQANLVREGADELLMLTKSLNPRLQAA